jgi:NAD(P)-dependent dehydrogenase (short-subunit alcohol dehydrogenase family)
MQGINLLVNCAGVIAPGACSARTAPWPAISSRASVHINLIGTVPVRQGAAADHADEYAECGWRTRRDRPHLSVAAFEGQDRPGCLLPATKAAVAGMTLPIARELAMFGIRVCSLARESSARPMLAACPQEVQESLGRQVPFPARLGGRRLAAPGADHLRSARISMAKPSGSMAPFACSPK